MDSHELAGIERLLRQAPDGHFSEAELRGLPDPVRRYLRGAIAFDTPLARSARIEMDGEIKVGRWLPFRARETLAPHAGFVWAARAAGIISGSDHYADGEGELHWRLAGILRLVRAAGPDVSRSAAERAAAEAVWLPTSLLPRFGVEWRAADETHLAASYAIDGRRIEVRYELSSEGAVRSLAFERWGDPSETGRWAPHAFGGEFTDHETFDGVTIPSAGRLGWYYGTERWLEGEFFRFRITSLLLDLDSA